MAPDKPGVLELDPQQAGSGNRIEVALPHEEVTMRFTAIDQDIYVPLPKAKKMPRPKAKAVPTKPKRLEALEDDYDSYADAIDELLKAERQEQNQCVDDNNKRVDDNSECVDVNGPSAEDAEKCDGDLDNPVKVDCQETTIDEPVGIVEGRLEGDPNQVDKQGDYVEKND